jgi:drug/metabolite transporter (DMT)-like permease
MALPSGVLQQSSGVVYGLTAATMLGLSSFIYKTYLSQYSVPVYITVAYSWAFIWYLALTTFIRPGTNSSSFEFAPLSVALLGFVVITMALGVGFSIRAVKLGELSYVAPLYNLVPLFVLPLEVVLFRQRFTLLELIGILCATAAVYAVNYESGSIVAPLTAVFARHPARLALAGAGFFALTDLAKRVTLQEVAVPPSVLVATIFFGMVVCMTPFAARRWLASEISIRSNLLLFAITGALVSVGEYAVALAFGSLPASLASPLVSFQSVVAVVLGGLVLQETDFRRRIVASFLLVCSVALIAF